jgi:hypothetical protein
VVLLGDGIKVAKEAERMPGVKKLHQESDNSTGKPPPTAVDSQRLCRSGVER